jgi:Holliday junction resolvasome RuvABC endonuclease subunit
MRAAVTTTVIGIDPGTSKCGVAVLTTDRKPRILACFALIAPHGGNFGMAPYRLVWLEQALTERIEELGLIAGMPVTVIAEHLRGMRKRPTPALESMIVMLHQWATARGWGWVEYAPAQWRRVVALRGAGQPNKQDVRFWMEAEYPQLRELRKVDGGMDAIEAAAIGRYGADLLRFEPAAAGGRS